MNAECDPVEARPADSPAEPSADLSTGGYPEAGAVASAAAGVVAGAAAGAAAGAVTEAMTGMITEPPAGLVALYRDLLLYRQADWAGVLTGHWDHPWQGIAKASRQIREHPYWRTLLDPAAVARAARDLRELGVRDPDDGPPAQPFRPVRLEEDQTFTVGPKDPRVRRELARELNEAGLWDELTPPERRAEREFVEQTGCPLRYGLVHLDRRFSVDPEDTSASGVMSRLDVIAPALAASGVALEVTPAGGPFRRLMPGGGGDFALEINGLRCEIRTADDPRTPAGSHGYGYATMMRPFIVINELLAAAGSRDRIYADPNGDTVYLLPEKVRAVLVQEIYEGYDERSLVLADRSVWNAPAA